MLRREVYYADEVLDWHEEFDVRGDASVAHIDQIHEVGGHHDSID
jgi:hypothetical protein